MYQGGQGWPGPASSAPLGTSLGDARNQGPETGAGKSIGGEMLGSEMQRRQSVAPSINIQAPVSTPQAMTTFMQHLRLICCHLQPSVVDRTRLNACSAVASTRRDPASTICRAVPCTLARSLPSAHSVSLLPAGCDRRSSTPAPTSAAPPDAPSCPSTRPDRTPARRSSCTSATRDPTPALASSDGRTGLARARVPVVDGDCLEAVDSGEEACPPHLALARCGETAGSTYSADGLA